MYKLQARTATRAKAAAILRKHLETIENNKEFWQAFGKAGGGISQKQYLDQERKRLKALEGEQ